MIVADAAAEVARESFFYFLLCGMRIFVEESFRSHDHSRRAESALECGVVDKGLLQRIEHSCFLITQSLDRCDVLPSHSIVRILQEATAFPSMITVQAPHAPWPQAALVPVNPSVSLSVKTSVCAGSICPGLLPTSRSYDWSFTVKLIDFVAATFFPSRKVC
jgi:hypothetical protein